MTRSQRSFEPSEEEIEHAARQHYEEQAREEYEAMARQHYEAEAARHYAEEERAQVWHDTTAEPRKRLS